MKQPILLAGVLVVASVSAESAQRVSLAGQWRFRLDRLDAGLEDHWFERKLPEAIKLPGTLTAQGIGYPIATNTPWTGSVVDRSWFTAPEYAPYRSEGNIKVPFWLQPERYYSGAAWYQRDIEIPADWAGKRIVLSLERPHWETRVWLDEKLIGANNSLATPHDYDLGSIAPGKHTLTIRVDNRMIVDVGENSHSISDHTQGDWNGIVGKIELNATPLIWIQDLQLYPNAAQKSVRVVVVSTNATHKPFTGKLSLFFEANGKAARLPVSHNFSTAETELRTEDIIELGPDALLWDEFSPNLNSIRAELRGELDGRRAESDRTVTYGLRDIATEGTQFVINGQKTFIRGTLDCCIYPKTGHPPTDVESWKRVIRICKEHGLNLIRFHSWCPPEAAFEAADELGFYFHVEASSWANQSTTLGDGKPVDVWIYAETDRILKHYGNHPSFILMPYGNEPAGDKHTKYLANYVNHYKALDPRRLWSSGAGWPQIAENQFHVTPDPRIQAWGEGLKSRINARPPETTTDYRDYIRQRTVPVISHEIGQWCVYPNFDEIPSYTGYLKPKNFEIFRDTLARNGMADLAREFLFASGKLQALCYKEEIESALRTPGMGGFELLDLHDFPGQGTALVGVLDPFWNEKGYVTATEYARFCNSIVPLARMKKRVFTADEGFAAGIELAHYGADAVARCESKWKLVASDGHLIANGNLPPTNLSPGNLIPLGQVSAGLQSIESATKCNLSVQIEIPGRRPIENDWDIWVYPTNVVSESADVLVTSRFDKVAAQRLASGGKVLLTLPGEQVRNFDKRPVKLGFSSIFWNTAWTERQPPTTLGLLCDPRHAALAAFPTEGYSNWQWWYLVHRAGALRLDLLPPGIQPVVRLIDDWVTARPLGMIIEAKAGAGRIMICGFDLTSIDAADPVSRQMRHSLLTYMNSEAFRPKANVSSEQIRNLIQPAKP